MVVSISFGVAVITTIVFLVYRAALKKRQQMEELDESL
jgi:hypothetical protein